MENEVKNSEINNSGNIEEKIVDNMEYDVLTSNEFNPDEECNVIFYYPGNGGAEADAKEYYNSIDDLGPNTVVVIQKTNSAIDDKTKCITNATEVIDNLGYTPANINFTGFSKRGLYPEEAAVNYIENGKYKDANIKITEIDPAGWDRNWGDPAEKMKEQGKLDLLKSRNVQMDVELKSGRDSQPKEHAEKMKESINEVKITEHSGDHPQTNLEVIENQIKETSSTNSLTKFGEIKFNSRNNEKPIALTCEGTFDKINKIRHTDLNTMITNVENTQNVNNRIVSNENFNGIVSEGNKGCTLISSISYCLAANLGIDLSNLGLAIQSYYDLDSALSKSVGESLIFNSIQNFNEPKYNKNYKSYDGMTSQYKVDLSGYLKTNDSTILKASDLNGFATKKSLEEAKKSARETKNNLAELKEELNDSAKFSGDEWNQFANLFQKNINCLAFMEAACVKYEIAYDNALKKIRDYLGDDLELQYSQLSDLKLELQNTEQQIANLKSKVNKTKIITEYITIAGHKLIPYRKEVPYYSGDIIDQFNDEIYLLENKIKVELQKNIKKLEGLPEIIESAENEINAVVEEIEIQFGNAVNSVH